MGGLFGILNFVAITLFLFFIVALTSLGILVLIVDGAFFKKVNKVGLSIIFIVVLSFVFFFCTRLILTGVKQSNAQKIIVDLENYKVKTGKYPENLKIIGRDKVLIDFNYKANSLGNTFTLSYSIDGWNINVYDSELKQWEETD